MSDQKKGGFDLLKLVKSGLEEAAPSAGMWFVGRALNAAGLPVGDQTKKRLAEIQSELDVIAADVVAVQNQLTAMSKALDIGAADLQSQIGLAAILPSVSDIEAAMIDLCAYISAGKTDCQRLSIYKSGGSSNALNAQAEMAPSDYAHTFAENVLGAWHISGKMQTIRNGLLGSDSANSIIDAFADLGIKKMDAKQADLSSWYGFFEQSFIQWVTALQYGMILQCNALSIDVDPGTKATVAINWIDGSYKSMLKAVVDAFAGAAERMILSRYDPVVMSPGVSFVSPDVLNGILTRVDLLSSLLLSDGAGLGDPGIAVRQFLRHSQVSGSGGPSLQPPGAKYAASGGALAPIPSRYQGGGNAKMKNWYKCIDFTDSPTNLELVSFEQSDIRVARYHWDWSAPLPAAGSPLGASGLFANVVPRWYDKATLAQADGPGSDRVLFAGWTSADPITEELFFTPGDPVGLPSGDRQVHPWEYESFVDPNKDQDADVLLTKKIQEIDFTAVPYTFRSGFTIPSEHSYMNGKGDARHKFKVKRSFHYRDGASSPVVHFFHEGKGTQKSDYRVYRDHTTGAPGGESAPVSIDLELKALRFKSYEDDNDKMDSSIDTLFTPSPKQVSGEYAYKVLRQWSHALEPGWYYTLQWRIYITAERQHTNKNLGWYHGDTQVEAGWSIDWIRLAWEQPKLLS